MPAPGHQIHVYGEHAAIHIDHRQGADLEALIPLLRDLAQEIAALPSAEQRKTLAAHVETARHEAEHADKADPDRIKRVLDIIKSGAEGLEHGSKIIMLCNKAYNVTAPLLGLPPSPLP